VKYESGGAFRMALEARLRAEALETNAPLARLRKLVAFDRLLARMMSADQQDRWLLKGGLALQVRMLEGARTTKDIDVLLRESGADAHRRLVEASKRDLDDWFEFEVAPPQTLTGEAGVRVPMRCRLDSREFESFHVDIGVGDPVVADPESFVVTDILEFAGISPTTVRCYPIAQHLAEKIHALTRPHGDRENSRVKDLVDVVIIAEASALMAQQAREALDATFAARHTHPVPERLPTFPRLWSPAYRRMAVEAGVTAQKFEDGLELMERFINPLLDGSAGGAWVPDQRRWSDARSVDVCDENL
jgi:predicted nucleotidyltransferase component of viral defense system